LKRELLKTVKMSLLKKVSERTSDDENVSKFIDIGSSLKSEAFDKNYTQLHTTRAAAAAAAFIHRKMIRKFSFNMSIRDCWLRCDSANERRAEKKLQAVPSSLSLSS
jgi:hypothetical protein